MKILLIRHGDVAWPSIKTIDGLEELEKWDGLPNLPLLPQGRERIKNLAKNLNYSLGKIVCHSGLLRCVQSSIIFCVNLNGMVFAQHCMQEWGALNYPKGDNFKKFVEKLKAGAGLKEIWFDNFLGFETPKDFRARIERAIISTKRKGDAHKPNVVMTHAEGFWATESIVYGTDMTETMNLEIGFGHIKQFEV